MREVAPDVEIAVIGAGVAGLGTAVALKEAGHEDFVIFEKASSVGGVWRDNRYPGVAVDIPALAYQFTWFPKPDWSHIYPQGSEVKGYLEDLTTEFGLRPHLRLDSPVEARVWDEDRHLWELTVAGETITARWVISAIGNFVLPRKPDIAGVEDFGGKVITSQDWDEDADLRGKRVAVIGTGASAVQLIPEVAQEAAHLDVYQRTPIWVVPKIDPAVPPAVQELFRRRPDLELAVGKRLRDLMEFLLIGGVLNYFKPSGRRAVAAITWSLRDVFFRRCVPDPGLRARLTPRYGFGCKRPSLSSRYLRTFNQPHVELVCDPIERVTAKGVRTLDGIERPVDVLVLATGFHMAHEPEAYRVNPVRGRDGFDLAETYATQRSRSYEGVAVPGLPNHLFVYGPYGGTGGTYHDVVHMASAHILRVLGEAQARGATCVEVTEEAADRWTEEMRRRTEGSLFRHNSCALANSYYFDRNGDVTFLRPTSSEEAFAAQHEFPMTDYRFETLSPSRIPTAA